MRVFVLHSSRPSHWQSLNVIYQQMSFVFELFPCPVTWLTSAQDFSQITFQSSDVIYVLDANACLSEIVPKVSSDVVWVIPIYGDMTIEYRRWEALAPILKGRRVKFLAASGRSAKQIEALTQGAVIKVVPYPVSESFFENKVEIKRSPQLLFYAGRLTAQKNVLELMASVIRANSNGAELKLRIAGNFHSRGYHFHSKLVDMYLYERTFFDLIEEAQGALEFVGPLPQDKLKESFQEASHVVSLSTYHDEDFGVSVAQGMAAGCTPILTDWGGHEYFLGSKFGRKVSVKVDEWAIPHPVSAGFVKTLLTLGQNSPEEISQWARNHFSLQAVRSQIWAVLAGEFEIYLGQSELFYELAQSFKEHREIPFYHRRIGFRDLYLRVYASYLGFS